MLKQNPDYEGKYLLSEEVRLTIYSMELPHSEIEMDIEEKRRRNREHKKKKYWENAEKERERKREHDKQYRAQPHVAEKRKENAKIWRESNPERVIKYCRDSRGLPEPTRPEPKVCEACGNPPSGRYKNLCLDHDHSTGEFRAWLCHPCNVALGYVKDNVNTLRQLATLLENHNMRA